MSDRERRPTGPFEGDEIGDAVEVDGELRIVTEASVWLIRPAAYLRLPRREGPRSVLSPSLADAVWHPHVGVWRIVDGDLVRYRLLPARRHPGSVGVVTGVVEAEPRPAKTSGRRQESEADRASDRSSPPEKPSKT